MTTVAVLSLPFRLDHALAWIERNPDPVRLVVASAEAIDESRLLPGTIVHTTRAQPPTDTAERLLRSGLARRFIRWVRRGSRIGGRIERAIRRAIVRQQTQPDGRPDGQQSPVDLLLLKTLCELEAADPITYVAVFDVSDLPTVLAFAHKTGAEVAVR
jgi:hypothetical protein